MTRAARLCFIAALSMLANAVAASPSLAGKSVYLMRGLWDVSTGLDDLAAKLKRRGMTAVVKSYTDEAELTEAAIRGYKSGSGCPIVIIGHSLGADAAVRMAESLEKATVPIALLVAFSPASARTVPANVARAVNYYQTDSIWNYIYAKAPGFKGTLRNVNLAKDTAIHHFNIEKNPKLHAETIRAIASLPSTCALGATPPLAKSAHPSAGK